jgi:hypothetical protein
MNSSIFKSLFFFILVFSYSLNGFAAADIKHNSNYNAFNTGMLTNSLDTFVTKKKAIVEEKKTEERSSEIIDKLSKESLIFSIVGLAGIIFLPGTGLILTAISFNRNKKINALIKRGELASKAANDNLNLTQIFNIIASIFHGLFIAFILLYIAFIVALILIGI